MNYEAVCRTAPATPGLLNTYIWIHWIHLNFNKSTLKHLCFLNFKLYQLNYLHTFKKLSVLLYANFFLSTYLYIVENSLYIVIGLITYLILNFELSNKPSTALHWSLHNNQTCSQNINQHLHCKLHTTLYTLFHFTATSQLTIHTWKTRDKHNIPPYKFENIYIFFWQI